MKLAKGSAAHSDSGDSTATSTAENHKRAHDSSSNLEHQSCYEHGTKRQRTHVDHTHESRPKILFVHQVECTGHLTGHGQHHYGLYLDQPRLFTRDTKASALRGIERIESSLEEYLMEEVDATLVVLRRYNCTKYVTAIEHDFESLGLPNVDAKAAASIRPYFYVLQDPNPKPANSYKETIVISHGLESAIEQLSVAKPHLLPGWQANLHPPYLQIYLTRDQIRASASEFLTGRAQDYILNLLEYVEDSVGAEYRRADNLFAQGLVTKEHISKLFGPNELVVKHDKGEPTGYISEVCPISTIDDGLVLPQCHHWTFDGVFRRENKLLAITWPGNKDESILITDLEVYPLRFDTSGKMEHHLRDRGKMFWSCRKKNFVAAVAQSASFEVHVSNPRYMIDTMTYHELHPEEQQNKVAEKGSQLKSEVMDIERPPDGPFVLLLPPRIKGFGMHDKKWRTLLVKDLRSPTWNKRAFNQLVLDPQKKELMEAMIKIHVQSNMSTDVIEGKGNGLIILLHGGPGTGKTLTAESVAELAEKPLYRVTCGDIGTTPESVEDYLESVLYLGKIWKAVLLLDESDVFLEEREKTDLQRNALVSVFLRALEYYEGILILTSNRVGIFDEAFKSRVQLALHYPPLDYKGRWEIWDNFITLFEQQEDDSESPVNTVGPVTLAAGERISVKELRDKQNVLANEKLNGRQIRNAITTARQLARHRNQPLGYTHLSQTISIANEFEEYVEKTHGHKAGDYAKATGTRLE